MRQSILLITNWILTVLVLFICSFFILSKFSETNYLEIQLRSKKETISQLFFDYGSGFSEGSSAKNQLISSRLENNKYKLIGEELSQLRFDPSNDEFNTVNIVSIQLRNGIFFVKKSIPKAGLFLSNECKGFNVGYSDGILDTGSSDDAKLLFSPKSINQVNSFLKRDYKNIVLKLSLLITLAVIIISFLMLRCCKRGCDLMKDYSLLILCSLCSLFYAMLNGAPLLFADSGTYIHSSISNTVSSSRPFAYSLWIKLTSLNLSLWIPIFIQGLVAALSFKYLCKEIGLTKRRYVLNLVLILTLLTPFSVFLSQLMPDVFAGILAVLLSAILLFGKSKSKMLFCCILYIVIESTHTTFHLITVGVIIINATYFFVIKNTKRLTCTLMLVLIPVLSIGFTSLTHMILSGNPKIIKDSDLFIMTRLGHLGLLEDFVSKEENKGRFYIENHMYTLKKMQTARSSDFIFYEHAPYRTNTEAREKEIPVIISEIFSNPYYVWHFIKCGIQEAIVLLWEGASTLSIYNWNFPWLFDLTKDTYKFNSPNFESSLQFQGEINEFICPRIYNAIEKMNLLLFIPLLIYLFKKNKKKLLGININLLLFVLINDYLTATLSVIDSRYHSRVSWVLLIGLLMTVYDFLSSRHVSRNISIQKQT